MFQIYGFDWETFDVLETWWVSRGGRLGVVVATRDSTVCDFSYYILFLGCTVTQLKIIRKPFSDSLFQALSQWGRIGKKRGTSEERGLVEK